MTDIANYVGNVTEFPILSRIDFYNHAGVAPISGRGANAIRRYAEQAESAAYVGAGWYREIEALRTGLAKLLNAEKEEIALVKNTSEGIAIVARGVSWRAGDRIVTTNVEYPANIYPWMDVAKREGAELVMVEERSEVGGSQTQGQRSVRTVPREAILDAASRPGTRMVALSHAEFASGQRNDIATIGRFCRERGILFCVDAIQTLGIFPVDVKGMCIDYLSADGHKWLLGPEGAGVFYVRRELIEETHPPQVGWNNVVNAQDYGRYDFTFRPDAGRYESGSPNVPGFLALRASLEMLMDVGVEAISSRIKALTDRVAAGVEEKGYRVASPREGQAWSGAVVFASDRHDHAQLAAWLRKEKRIELAVREGRLRCSPHFYKTESQIDRLVEALPGH